MIFIELNKLYKRTNHYKNSQLISPTFLKGVPYNIQFANFGSTYSQYAFGTYKNLGIDFAYNFALPCESSEADYEKIKALSSHLAPNCIVAITIAPCNTLYNWGDLNEGIKHYGLIPKKKKKDWNIVSFIQYYFPIFPFNIKKVARILYDSKSFTDIYDYYPSHAYDISEIQEKANCMVKNWINLFGLKNLSESILNINILNKVDENVSILRKMIDYCFAHKYQPVIVVPPFANELNHYFSDAFIDSTLGPVFEMAKLKGVKIYNFRTDEEFQDNHNLYADGYFCLNRNGSEKFLNSLFLRMRKDGYIIRVPNDNK